MAAGTMDDYNSSLPVRTEADADQKVQVKIMDYADPDGVGKQMQVDADGNAHVELHGNDSGGTDRVVKLSESGNVALDGDYDGTTNTNPSSAGLILHDRVASPAIADQNFRPTGVQGTALNTVHAMDIALHDESGDAFSDANPLPVYLAQDPGAEQHNYYEKDIAVFTSGATVIQEHAVPTGVYELHQVLLSSAVRASAQIQYTTDNVTWNTIGVRRNSTSEPNFDMNLEVPFKLTGGANAKFRVQAKNRDKDASDLDITFVGILK